MALERSVKLHFLRPLPRSRPFFLRRTFALFPTPPFPTQFARRRQTFKNARWRRISNVITNRFLLVCLRIDPGYFVSCSFFLTVVSTGMEQFFRPNERGKYGIAWEQGSERIHSFFLESVQVITSRKTLYLFPFVYSRPGYRCYQENRIWWTKRN